MIKRIKCRVIEPAIKGGNDRSGLKWHRSNGPVSIDVHKSDHKQDESESEAEPSSFGTCAALLPARRGRSAYYMERIYPGGMVVDFVA
jgi:hypothetical protein